jgi:hypothetical protein
MTRYLTAKTTTVVALLVLGPALASDEPAAQFEGKDTLRRPERYREWVFVGSSQGLRYNEKDDKQQSDKLEFKNVYINPEAYRGYLKTGKFPEGTILMLETAAAATKAEPGLRGSYQKEFTGLSAAVKDSKRFGDGWAYYSFSAEPGKPKATARPFPKAACFDCHHEKAADDNVFTQFYPVLRPSVNP